MLKHVALLGVLATFGAASAYAQTTTTPNTAPAKPAASPQMATAGVDTKKLIGRNIKNSQNETIGEIKSIQLGKDGKVDTVMVGVGGFLGMGEREVALAWKDLVITENGEKVTVNMTKDQLKAMPEYKYTDPTYRGTVFGDNTTRGTTTAPADRMASSTPASTGDFNAAGNISANALIGAAVKNAANETVGTVSDVYVDTSGAIKQVVVSVGGFLGMGARYVAVPWQDIKSSRDGNSLLLKTTWTKESLKAMPEYKYERRAMATPAGQKN